MKVIDLLNKIANGEIKENTKFRRIGVLHCISGKDVDYFTYIKDGIYKVTFKDGSVWNYDYKVPFEIRLNNEVEIIEEPKKIEEVDILTLSKEFKNLTENEILIMQCVNRNSNKLNEIIDYINKEE